MKKNKLIPTLCPICSTSKNYQILYKKNFNLPDFNINIFSARRLPDKIHYQIVKCRQCSLVRSNPILSKNELVSLYRQSKFTYDQETENLTTTYLDILFPTLKKLTKNANILEIGCGNGFILHKLSSLGYKNLHGIEPSLDATKKTQLKNKDIIKTTVLKNGLYPKNSFDFIFFFQTFDHIPNPLTFLNLCRQYLKSNGYILSFNHNINSFSSKILGEKSPIIDIEHTHLYSPNTMTKLFKKTKYRNITISCPANTVSLYYILFLAPLPAIIKNIILKNTKILKKVKLKIKLGNLCLAAQK